jgi:hypothetical protein
VTQPLELLFYEKTVKIVATVPKPPLGQLQCDKVVAVDVAGVVEEDGVRGERLEAEGEDGACPRDPAGEGEEGVPAAAGGQWLFFSFFRIWADHRTYIQYMYSVCHFFQQK